MTDLRQMREMERWLALIRIAGVAFAVFQVAVGSDYPHNYQGWAWVTTGLFAAGTLVRASQRRARPPLLCGAR